MCNIVKADSFCRTNLMVKDIRYISYGCMFVATSLSSPTFTADCTWAFMLHLLRRWDLNPRPSAYEADELPTATTPRCYIIKRKLLNLIHSYSMMFKYLLLVSSFISFQLCKDISFFWEFQIFWELFFKKLFLWVS